MEIFKVTYYWIDGETEVGYAATIEVAERIARQYDQAEWDGYAEDSDNGPPPEFRFYDSRRRFEDGAASPGPEEFRYVAEVIFVEE